MEQITRLILLISGMYSFSSCISQHRYFLVKTPKTWVEAQSYCREKCFDLATVDDMSDVEALLEAAEGKYDDAAWIGLSKGSTLSWHWSLADNHFYKEGERNYLIWGYESPNNCGSYLNGKLYSIACNILLNPVCFNGKNGEEQYVLVKKGLDWTSARDYCRTYYSDLSSVRNENESRIIQEVAAGSRVWVGLFRDPWKWSDQNYSSMRYWKAYQPVVTVGVGQTCAAMLKIESGRWGELQCNEKLPFACNCPIVRTIKIRLSSQDSVLEQNDPAVLDDILKQLKQKLETESGEKTKVQWKKHADGRVFIK